MDADAYGAIETVILFRLAGTVIDAFVAASRNRVPVEEGWGTARECLAEDVELSVILNYDAAGTHTFCGFVGEVRNVITPASPTAWKARRRLWHGAGPRPGRGVADGRLSASATASTSWTCAIISTRPCRRRPAPMPAAGEDLTGPGAGSIACASQ